MANAEKTPILRHLNCGRRNPGSRPVPSRLCAVRYETPEIYGTLWDLFCWWTPGFRFARRRSTPHRPSARQRAGPVCALSMFGCGR